MFRTRFRTAAAIFATATATVAVGARAQTPIPPSARDFALMASQSDEYEIQARRTAAAQAVDGRVRAFAQQMITDHDRTRDALRQAAAASGLPPPPPGMSSDQARMLAALQGLTGREFDRAYARQQVMAHNQALAVQQSYAGAGSDPNLRRAARAAVPVISGHLDMAQQLLASVGGGS